MNDSAICGQEVSQPLGIAPTRGDSPSRKYDVKIERREPNGEHNRMASRNIRQVMCFPDI